MIPDGQQLDARPDEADRDGQGWKCEQCVWSLCLEWLGHKQLQWRRRPWRGDWESLWRKRGRGLSRGMNSSDLTWVPGCPQKYSRGGGNKSGWDEQEVGLTIYGWLKLSFFRPCSLTVSWRGRAGKREALGRDIYFVPECHFLNWKGLISFLTTEN